MRKHDYHSFMKGEYKRGDYIPEPIGKDDTDPTPGKKLGEAIKPRFSLAPIEPVELDDLIERAGPYGDAAKVYCEWSAVTLWLMSGDAYPALREAGIPAGDASRSVCLVSPAAANEAGWPWLSDKPINLPIYGLSPDDQCAAQWTAEDVFALWEKAGRPKLPPRTVRHAFRYLVACARKGIIPHHRGLGDDGQVRMRKLPLSAQSIAALNFKPQSQE